MQGINWNVGEILVYENSWNSGKTKIVRETPTTFVLENGDKIKKGRRFPIGEHGYGIACYYSANEPEGKRILDKFIRDGKYANFLIVTGKICPTRRLIPF